MSCVAASAATLAPLLIPVAIVMTRVAAPALWRATKAAHERRRVARAEAKICAPVVTPPEKSPRVINALPALVGSSALA